MFTEKNESRKKQITNYWTVWINGYIIKIGLEDGSKISRCNSRGADRNQRSNFKII